MSFSAMFYKKVFTFITLQFAFIPLFTSTVKAEGEDYYMQGNREEILEKTLEALKLPKGSRHIKKLFSPPEESTPIEEKYPQRIIKHIKGNSGERFATEEEILDEMVKVADSTLNLPDDVRKLLPDETLEPQPENSFDEEELLDLADSIKKDMPICSQSSTERQIKGVGTPKLSDKVIFDFIMVNHNTPLPKDLGKSFGNNVIVIIRDDGKDIISQILLDNNVMCLPARIRATDKVTFIDQGLNALKNYDQNFYGQGILDQEVLSIMKIQ